MYFASMFYQSEDFVSILLKMSFTDRKFLIWMKPNISIHFTLRILLCLTQVQKILY